MLIATLSLSVQAGIPTPKGVWEFNAPDPVSATIGAPLELVGTAQSISGVTAEDDAMTIGEGIAWSFRHAFGSKRKISGVWGQSPQRLQAE